MASILVFTVLVVASLSGIMVYGQTCADHLQRCGPLLIPCCQKMVCWANTNNTQLGVCRKLLFSDSEAGAPTIALKPLSVIVILTSFWGLCGHLIA